MVIYTIFNQWEEAKSIATFGRVFTAVNVWKKGMFSTDRVLNLHVCMKIFKKI